MYNIEYSSAHAKANPFQANEVKKWRNPEKEQMCLTQCNFSGSDFGLTE